jgi:cytochrome c oxidase subunit 2
VHRKTLLALGMVSLAVVAVACDPNATQSSLEPAGEEARKAYNLFVPVFWVAVGIFILVEGALVLFALRYRHRKGRESIPPQIHGNTRLEIAWTILPAVILAGVAVPTVTTIFDLARDPGPRALDVTVLAHQWWWEFDYPDQGVNTANELHIPTGRPVYLRMCAVGLGYENKPSPSECQPAPQKEGAFPASVGDAVIHSFWPPELAGTQDVIPGRVSTMVLEADEPGVYEGQCKEYCGLSHTYMRFTVVAHTPSDFERWVREQQAPALAIEPGGPAVAGAQIFAQRCTACHIVFGLEDASGEPIGGNNSAPNLTHFMSRDCFRGCTMPITRENLERWLRNPQAVEAGSWMILDPPLTEQEIDDLIAFLETLN